MRIRDRRSGSLRMFLSLALLLCAVPFTAGCGGDSGGTSTLEVDQAKIQAEQDAMRDAMQKGYSSPDTAKRTPR